MSSRSGERSAFARIALGDPDRVSERVGVPDLETGASVVMREVNRATITNAAGGDVHVIAWPFYVPRANGVVADRFFPLVRPAVPGEVTLTYPGGYPANALLAGGVTAWAGAAGAQFLPSRANPTVGAFTAPVAAVQVQPSDAALAGRSRLVGRHVKVVCTSNPIQVTGSKLQWQQRATFNRTMRKVVNGAVSTTYPFIELNLPVAVDTDAALLADNLEGKAIDGAFQPVLIDFNDEFAKPRYLEGINMALRGPSGYDTGAVPAVGVDLCNYDDTIEAGAATVHFEAKRLLPCDYSGVFFKGVQAGATFDIIETVYFERFPDQNDTAYLDSARARPAPDLQDLEIVNATFRICPLFFNAEDNASGFAWNKIASTMKSVVGKIAKPAAALAGPALKTLANEAITVAVARATAVNPMLGMLAREAAAPARSAVNSALTVRPTTAREVQLVQAGETLGRSTAGLAQQAVTHAETYVAKKKKAKKKKHSGATLTSAVSTRNGRN